MKSLSRKILGAAAAAALVAGGALSAQDASDPSAASDSFSFDDVFASGAGGDSGSAGTAAPALEFHGAATVDARAWLGTDPADETNAVSANPSVKLGFSWKGTNSELEGKLAFDEAAVKENPADLLEEVTARAFLGDFVLEAGKMKVVWGRGDKLHVLDPFNANDYTDFIIPDYIDRRLAEPMARLSWNGPAGFRAEAVWTPTMTPDRLDMGGRWTPAQATALTEAGTGYVTYLSGLAYAAAYSEAYEAVWTQTKTAVYQQAYAAAVTGGADAAAAASMAAAAVATYVSDHNAEIIGTATGAASAKGLEAAQNVLMNYGSVDALLPDTKALKYGQYGLRLTGTIGLADLGAEYYYGHFKTPSAKVTYGANALGETAVTALDLDYDRLQIFGADAAAAVGFLNLRGEIAWYLTDDVKGDDPAVHNNSLQWLAGFDIPVPVSNMALNVQEIGSWLYGSDGIESGADADWNADGKWTNNKLVVLLSDSWNHDKVKPEIACVWGIERRDIYLQSKLSVTLKDGFSVIASGGYFIRTDTGEFAPYGENNYAQLSAKYEF